MHYQQGEDVKAKFKRLKQAWLRERPKSSKLRDLVLSMPYQCIIGIGPAAVPLLLQELREAPENWFWALEAITQENPVPEDADGDVDQITQAWLKWATDNGF
ncbi:MAG TPA: hypothetical protein VG944_08345 [Fimbriimonas sp.]|nr:hypothetical protein [Fimbriimonas sp.]